MKQFDADKLWWNDKVQRPDHKVKVPESAEELDIFSSSDLLSDWDSIVQCDDL